MIARILLMVFTTVLLLLTAPADVASARCGDTTYAPHPQDAQRIDEPTPPPDNPFAPEQADPDCGRASRLGSWTAAIATAIAAAATLIARFFRGALAAARPMPVPRLYAQRQAAIPPDVGSSPAPGAVAQAHPQAPGTHPASVSGSQPTPPPVLVSRSSLASGVPPLDATRTFGPGNLERVADLRYQRHLQQLLAAPNGGYHVWADPSTHPYGQWVNDGGPLTVGRSNNCLDCSLSALSSFHGQPEVSAPRWPDRLPNGARDNDSGEVDGIQRAERWLNDTWSGGSANLPADPAGRATAVIRQYQQLHQQIATAGPGASALVVAHWLALDLNGNVVTDHNGAVKVEGAHAFVVVYPTGASSPVWWDPQHGTTWSSPPWNYVSLTHSLWWMNAAKLAPPTVAGNPPAAHTTP